MRLGYLQIVALLLACAGAHADETPTFTADIAPIMVERCVTCHRPGSIGPMSLTTFEEARPWAKAIARETGEKRMPPFHAAGELGRYVDDPRLTDAQIATIADWAAQGSPEGDPALMPPLPVFNDGEWTFGEPDVIVNFPPVAIDALESEEFVWLYSEGLPKETLWFRAVEVRTQQRKYLHHVNVFVRSPNEEVIEEGGVVPEEARGVFRGIPMMSWLPGQGPMVYPEESPGRLTEGWGLILDSHYVPADEPLTDQIQLGFYAATGTVLGYNKQLGVNASDILIQPHDPKYVKVYRLPFEEDAIVTGFHAHMHYRGKSVHVRLTYPGGRVQNVLTIPQWDVAWQRDYLLAEPMHVPKGTVGEFVGIWDNSANNPANPDPNAVVPFGDESKNEMFNAVMFYRPAAPLETPVRIVDGREVPETD